MRDRGDINKGIDNKEIKDATDKNEVAQLGLSPLQSMGKGNCKVDCEVNCVLASLTSLTLASARSCLSCANSLISFANA